MICSAKARQERPSSLPSVLPRAASGRFGRPWGKTPETPFTGGPGTDLPPKTGTGGNRNPGTRKLLPFYGVFTGGGGGVLKKRGTPGYPFPPPGPPGNGGPNPKKRGKGGYGSPGGPPGPLSGGGPRGTLPKPLTGVPPPPPGFYPPGGGGGVLGGVKKKNLRGPRKRGFFPGVPRF